MRRIGERGCDNLRHGYRGGHIAQPFAHLQAQNAALYRQILTVFVRAKQRFTVHLRPEDVLGELGANQPLETVRAALDQLGDWGNLRADPDTGRVTTVEDFHRARYLYQLSPEGHAAEQAIATYEDTVGRRGALQPVALSDIAGQLRALLLIADEALFGLGSRYDALISLLIRLRQPQLSKRPDEKSLSRALGDALPPLDENLITQVAEAFRSLDDERETLRELAETKRAADEFLTRYRQYARVARAGAVGRRSCRGEPGRPGDRPGRPDRDRGARPR